MTTVETEQIIQRVVAKHVDMKEAYVFLFGSRASGREVRASDYDVGIYQGSPIPFVVFAKIHDELEEYPIPVHVDLVDFATVSEGFKRLALKEVKIWNKPKKPLLLI